MSKAVLSPLKQPVITFPHFPTVMQCFVFRNWDLIPVKKISRILGCTIKETKFIAKRMGLSDQDSDFSAWRTRGYLTIIRLNWHILPYSQLMQLLDIDQDELAYILREDDFLYIKMGDKPDVQPVKYTPLTPAQISATEELREIISSIPIKRIKNPFDFFNDENDEVSVITIDELYETLKEKDISYKIKPDESLKPESHFISISKDGIVVELLVYLLSLFSGPLK